MNASSLPQILVAGILFRQPSLLYAGTKREIVRNPMSKSAARIFSILVR
jgi:hypothetical protein